MKRRAPYPLDVKPFVNFYGEFFENFSFGNKCKLCDKVVKNKYQAKQHYEEMHLEAGFEFPCPLCPGKIPYETRNKLYQHTRYKHNTLLKREDLDALRRPKQQFNALNHHTL